MRFRIQLEVTEEGKVLANGERLPFVRVLASKDLRCYQGGNPELKKRDYVFRRDLFRSDMRDNYDTDIPRGVNLGDSWTVVVEAPLFGSWNYDLDEIDSFEEARREGADCTIIFFGDERIPVTEYDVVEERS